MLHPVTSFGIGAPVRRREDYRLLTGQGRYADDLNAPGQAYAAFVRSPHAHADVVAIDAAPARTVAGVLGVFTGRDLVAGGVGTIPTLIAERGVGLARRVEVVGVAALARQETMVLAPPDRRADAKGGHGITGPEPEACAGGRA